MSSEKLHRHVSSSYLWSANENRDDYVLATYLIRTSIEGELAAIGMAREQSICADALTEIEMPADLDRFRAKVMSAELVSALPAVAPAYFLTTHVYGNHENIEDERSYRVVIAYPCILFEDKLTRLWNYVFGEIHRLGYLRAVSLIQLDLPDVFACRFPGPGLGVAGLRQRLGITDRPLFCRSMRPACGIDTPAMLKLNEAVLRGGFDVIKDDELTYNNPRSPFKDRVRQMVSLKHRIEDETGERKFYFANVIDDLSDSLTQAEEAAELGADGVMVSVFAQGLSIIPEIVRRTGLAILAHNTCGDVLSRVPGWGVGSEVVTVLQRAAGADLVVSPGAFATTWQDAAEARSFLSGCRAPYAGWQASMPIIQGGKCPEQLQEYVRACGSVDFMIIAATWVDEHPKGMLAGARAFRDAWEILANNN